MSKAATIYFLILISQISLLAQPQVRDIKEGTAMISGRVTLKDEPARGVLVALQQLQPNMPPNQNPGLRQKTDDEGRYKFTGIAGGSYIISVLAPGFITPSENIYPRQGKPINISEGENVENLDFELKRGGVITGRVTDSNGKPMVDENIALVGLDPSGRPAYGNIGMNPYMYRTDDRGVYRLYGVPAGRYVLSVGIATEEGSAMYSQNRTYYPRTYYPDVTDRAKAKIIELSEGEEVTGVDISVGEGKKTYDVFGRVVDADNNQPVAGVELTYGAYQRDGRNIMWGGFMGERSNAQGEFQLQGILPGKYGVVAASSDRSEYYSDPTPLEIADSDISGVEVRVRRGGSISGVAVIEGTNDPALYARLSQLMLGVYTRSDQLNMPGRGGVRINPAGGFRITGLRPAKTEFSLYYSAGGRGGFSLLRVERDGIPQPEGIDLRPGEQLSNVRLVIGYGNGIMRGQLKIIGAEIPQGASFFIFAQRIGGVRTSGFNAQVDTRGQFLIEGLMAGAYEVRVTYFVRSANPANDSLLRSKFAQFKQTVNVAGSGETPVTLTIDVTQKEN